MNGSEPWEERALETPLEQLPVLYQLWGMLEVVLVLLEVAAKGGATGEKRSGWWDGT